MRRAVCGVRCRIGKESALQTSSASGPDQHGGRAAATTATAATAATGTDVVMLCDAVLGHMVGQRSCQIVQ